MKPYDYLVVGAGLYGAVFAQKAREKDKRVLVIEKILKPNTIKKNITSYSRIDGMFILTNL